MRLTAIFLGVLVCASAASADPAADWNEAAATLTKQDVLRTPGTPTFTPDNSVAQGETALAIFEAANSADPRYASFLNVPPASEHASAEAAVEQAAHDVLVVRYPDKANTLNEALVFDLAQIPDGPAKDAGIAAGRQAAGAVLAVQIYDPSKLQPYRPPSKPGVFTSPTLPSIPAESATARPWFFDTLDAVLPPPPPPLKSDRYARDFNETKELGAINSVTRAPAGTANADFWWTANDVMPALRAIDSRAGRTLVQNARTYALMLMTLDDVGTATAIAKFRYLAWRPIAAIRNADITGNPHMQRDAGWLPLIRTPNHPEYPCAHCVYAAATAKILAAEAGARTDDIYFASDVIPGAAMRVTNWDDYVDKVVLSRIEAGAHFRFSGEAAVDMGRKIAIAAIAKFAPPVSRHH
jgi:hypothetical protein